MIEIKEYFPIAEWNKMYLFARECYRPDHALCDKKFFEWLFNVELTNGKATVICGWDNGRLLGIHGYVPLSVHWGEVGKPIQAVWTMCWMVRKEAPMGLGWLITKKIQQMFPLVLSLNASNIGAPFLSTLGWSFFERVPRYLLVFDKEQCKHMLSPEAQEKDLDNLIFKADGCGTSSISELNVNPGNYHPQWQLYPDLAFGTVRSLDYILWRYSNHPIFQYSIALKGSPERPAVCIYRIEQAFGFFRALVVRIVDFFHPHDEQGKKEGIELLSNVLEKTKNMGCAYADFITSSKFFGHSVLDLGGDEEPPDRQILPVRLTPIERKTRHQNLIMHTGRELTLPVLEKMYITKSDFDGDSPAMIPIIDR